MCTKRLLVLFVGLAVMVGMAACGSATTTTIAASIATTAAPTTVSTAAPTTATTAAPYAGQTLTVSVAASLKAAFTEFAASFEQKTGAKIAYNFAASGVLQKQIEGGAPVDVFASASPKNMDPLTTANLVDPASVVTFAGNEMVLAVPAGSTLGITGFADLARGDVKRVTTADPVAAPQGKAAMEVLTGLNLLDTVKPKLIYAANAGQTYDYVARGEVDAAILYSTDVQGKTSVPEVERAPADSYTPVKYVIGIVTAGTAKPLAQAFIDALLSPDGQALLAGYGFKTS